MKAEILKILHNKIGAIAEQKNGSIIIEVFGIDEAATELAKLYCGSVSFDEVKNIWNAAEKYILNEIGEITKGDANYDENTPDLETYFEKYYA